MGSRYGGLKQVDSFGPNNESILDYSIFDAVKVGFDKIVILSSPKLENYFKDKYHKLFETFDNCKLDIVIQDPSYGLAITYYLKLVKNRGELDMLYYAVRML